MEKDWHARMAGLEAEIKDAVGSLDSPRDGCSDGIYETTYVGSVWWVSRLKEVLDVKWRVGTLLSGFVW